MIEYQKLYKIWRKYKMEEFATLEKVKELFEKVDFIGEENCFIYALTNKQILKNLRQVDF